jgi:hypothetical protein
MRGRYLFITLQTYYNAKVDYLTWQSDNMKRSNWELDWVSYLVAPIVYLPLIGTAGTPVLMCSVAHLLRHYALHTMQYQKSLHHS